MAKRVLDAGCGDGTYTNYIKGERSSLEIVRFASPAAAIRTSEEVIARHQGAFIRWPKRRLRGSADAGCGDKLVVSTAVEAYDALESDPNLKSRLNEHKFHPGLVLIATPQ
jgi:hypothetical protein